MSKKSLLVLAMTLSMVAILAIGGTLAYFTDTDAKTNVFTTGNVAIDLQETFVPGSKLLPGSKTMNNIQKEVYVENTGSEDAYVRVHIALPTILDDGDPSFDAGKNVLHFNNSNMGAGKWNWSTSLEGNDDSGENYIAEGGKWNFYTTTISGVSYNVYVVTYETALAKGDKTPAAMDQVYLDAKVTNDDITRITEALKAVGGFNIKVVAEGTQKGEFTDAFTALNTSFGVPGSYTIDWNAVDEESNT